MIEGGLVIEDRGTIKFVNNFNFNGVKRFYQIENFDKNTIRAFHGHLKEAKYVYVVSGSIILCAIPLDKAKKPSKKIRVERYVLSSANPKILYIPPGYANGFKALQEKTKVIFFSTSTLEESKKDDFKYPFDYWGKEIWQVNNR